VIFYDWLVFIEGNSLSDKLKLLGVLSGGNISG